MKLLTDKKNQIKIFFIFLISYIFCIHYFNYFETPTADYMGNFRPRILEYLNGIFPGEVFKIMPAYPLLVALFSKIGIVSGDDPIYISALALNFLLYIPYFFITYKIYKEFLDDKKAYIAMFFLGINIYTIYTAVNSELEMFLSLSIVLTIYLSLKDSKFAYLTSFFAATTKWDSVFTVPAVALKDFFIKKKRILSIVLGFLASTGALAWLYLSLTFGNTYVNEITRRGPNIYRYILDCFLTASSFLAWMGMDWWQSDSIILSIVLLPFMFFFALFVIISIIWGSIILFRENKKKVLPIYIFFSGFLMIHMVYQNSKPRYVMPILWLLYLFMFYGIFNGLVPYINNIITKFSDKLKRKLQIILILIFAMYLLFSFYLLIYDTTYIYMILAVLTFVVMKSLIHQADFPLEKIPLAIVLLISAAIINFTIYFGIDTMDHYSLRRVEFKQAALWFKQNANKNDRMLMTELNVAKYYIGESTQLISSKRIKTNDYEEAVSELKKNNINYVFVDDFYIRRLQINDKNAIERNAELMKNIKEKGVSSKNFEIIKKFDVKGKTGFIYKLL